MSGFVRCGIGRRLCGGPCSCAEAPADRAAWPDRARGVQRAQESLPDTEDLGGADAAKLSELTSAAEQANVTIEIVAPVVGGVETTDGQRVPADQKIDGGPSVLYDAVVVLASKQAASILSALPAARDFATDAFADLGRISAADFIARCAELRFWPRQASAAEPLSRHTAGVSGSEGAVTAEYDSDHPAATLRRWWQAA